MNDYYEMTDTQCSLRNYAATVGKAANWTPINTLYSNNPWNDKQRVLKHIADVHKYYVDLVAYAKESWPEIIKRNDSTTHT